MRPRCHWMRGEFRGVEDNPLSIYRQLLRQVGALHDDVARSYLSKHIRKRYEANRFPPDYKREIQVVREARHGVNLLKRANAGYPRPLVKVMESAYGRIGKRRHDLLKPILDYDKPIIAGDDPRAPFPFTSKPFLAILHWAKVKNVNIKIPEKNIWDMPFPKSREPRILQRNHTRLVEACPAPLPLDEFERLVRFAKGEEVPIPPRRKLKPSPPEEMAEHNGERPHDMTPRSWRRLYGKIVEKTCALQQILPSGEWQVISADIKPELPVANEEEFEVFIAPQPKKVRRK